MTPERAEELVAWMLAACLLIWIFFPEVMP